MVSLALAWVFVTAIKHNSKSVEIEPAMFIITGLVDILLVTAILVGLGEML